MSKYGVLLTTYNFVKGDTIQIGNPAISEDTFCTKKEAEKAIQDHIKDLKTLVYSEKCGKDTYAITTIDGKIQFFRIKKVKEIHEIMKKVNEK